jgi:hypothetical protein
MFTPKFMNYEIWSGFTLGFETFVLAGEQVGHLAGLAYEFLVAPADTCFRRMGLLELAYLKRMLLCSVQLAG